MCSRLIPGSEKSCLISPIALRCHQPPKRVRRSVSLSSLPLPFRTMKQCSDSMMQSTKPPNSSTSPSYTAPPISEPNFFKYHFTRIAFFPPSKKASAVAYSYYQYPRCRFSDAPSGLSGVPPPQSFPTPPPPSPTLCSATRTTCYREPLRSRRA